MFLLIKKMRRVLGKASKINLLLLVFFNSAYADYLDPSSWTLSASNNSIDLNQAIDGSLATRWSTKQTQRDGQFIDVDLGRIALINSIELDAGSSQNDFPRSYNILLSLDGTNWTQPVAIGTGATLTNISFATRKTRHVRIAQTGSSDAYWWSVHNLKIHEDTSSLNALDRSNWSLSSNINNNGLFNAIDGNSSTRWSSGAIQTLGQEFIIDFNNSEKFERLVLDSRNSGNDYPREYALSTSNDGENWTHVAISNHSEDGLTTISFLPQEARFAKIKQLGESDAFWWSIHELNVYINTTENNYQVPDNSTAEPFLLHNLKDLKLALKDSDGQYQMRPAYYTADALLDDGVTVFRATGSNNSFDFTNVTIDLPTQLLSGMRGDVHDFASFKLEGNNITFTNGTFINTYPDGTTTVTDFKAHNDDRSRQPGGSNVYFRVWGDNISLLNNTIIVRGSFPYGYGDMFGKGAGATYGLRKHAGIQVIGDNTLIDGLDLTVLAFGHGIFMQGADNTLIRNTTVKGRMRLGEEMYSDGADSLPGQVDFIQKHPYWYADTPIVKDRMYNLTEDGIRAYPSGPKLDGTTGNTGTITVKDTQVINMRGCISFAAAKKAAIVDNVDLRGCDSGFTLPGAGGEVVNSSSDTAFGPIIQIPYSNQRNQLYDITVVEPEFTTGNFPLTLIGGSNNTIILRSDGQSPGVNRNIMIGYTWDRWAFDENDGQQAANGVEIINFTEHEVELTKHSSNVTGSSVGKVTDAGADNDVE